MTLSYTPPCLFTMRNPFLTIIARRGMHNWSNRPTTPMRRWNFRISYDAIRDIQDLSNGSNTLSRVRLCHIVDFPSNNYRSIYNKCTAIYRLCTLNICHEMCTRWIRILWHVNHSIFLGNWPITRCYKVLDSCKWSYTWWWWCLQQARPRLISVIKIKYWEWYMSHEP